MRAPKEGWYWIRYRYRCVDDDLDAGMLSDWEPAWFRPNEDGYPWWFLFGDECGISEEAVEEVGHEIVFEEDADGQP